MKGRKFIQYDLTEISPEEIIYLLEATEKLRKATVAEYGPCAKERHLSSIERVIRMTLEGAPK